MEDSQGLLPGSMRKLAPNVAPERDKEPRTGSQSKANSCSCAVTRENRFIWRGRQLARDRPQPPVFAVEFERGVARVFAYTCARAGLENR
jgi:hypothetical protein